VSRMLPPMKPVAPVSRILRGGEVDDILSDWHESQILPIHEASPRDHDITAASTMKLI